MTTILKILNLIGSVVAVVGITLPLVHRPSQRDTLYALVRHTLYPTWRNIRPSTILFSKTGRCVGLVHSVGNSMGRCGDPNC